MSLVAAEHVMLCPSFDSQHGWQEGNLEGMPGMGAMLSWHANWFACATELY